MSARGRGTVASAFAALALLLVAGCGAERHGTAAYDGRKDPLVEKLADPAMQGRLQDRFKHGQADR